MDMHSGNGVLDSAQEIAIEKSVKVTRQAALNANFRCATTPGLAGTSHNYFERERAGVRRSGATSKSTETAAHETDIGEVNVAVDDVGDRLSHGFVPQMIRNGHQRVQSRTFRGREPQALLKSHLRAVPRFVQVLTHIRGASL